MRVCWQPFTATLFSPHFFSDACTLVGSDAPAHNNTVGIAISTACTNVAADNDANAAACCSSDTQAYTSALACANTAADAKYASIVYIHMFMDEDYSHMPVCMICVCMHPCMHAHTHSCSADGTNKIPVCV